jgi:hypothetical protein
MVEGEGGRRRARDESRHNADGTRGGAERARDESRRGGEQRRKLDEFVHLRRNWFTTKKVKNKFIGNGFILSLKINPSERIYFGIQKVKLIFHRLISKKSPTSTKPTYDKSARKKTTTKKKNVRD